MTTKEAFIFRYGWAMVKLCALRYKDFGKPEIGEAFKDLIEIVERAAEKHFPSDTNHLQGG